MMANETSSTDITNQVLFIGLAGFDNATQEMTPVLAKSWEVAPDGLTWTFHLRKGAAVLGRPSDHGRGRVVQFRGRVRRNSPPVGAGPAHHGRQEVGGHCPRSAHDRDQDAVAQRAWSSTLASSVPIMPKHVLEAGVQGGTFASAYNVSAPPERSCRAARFA